MEVIKSSTSEISFRIVAAETSINEQDFILINDLKKTPQKQYLAQVSNLIQTKGEEIKGTAIILGEIDLKDFALSPCRFPVSPEAQIRHPPEGLVSKIISYRGDNGIYLGDIITFNNQTDPFLISPDFLERHVLCVASTGAGKSYTVAVLLEEILMKFKSAAVMLFDTHNEYWGLTQQNDGPEIEYLNFEDYSPRGFLENVLVFEKESLGLGTRFNLPKLRRLISLTAAQENSLLNIIKEPLLLDDLMSLIRDSDIHSSTRENLISKIYSLENLRLFEKELDLDALIQPGRISIIRLDQFIDERKRNLLVNEILTQVFEKKLQGELAREHEIILVIEEAHRFANTNEILPRIAREGRKFGIHEILISQRPGDLPDNIVANMNTLIALRIRSDKDITKIRLMEGISTETVSILPHLVRGEALIVGLHGGSHRPIKIRVRPRLSKHIDPQEDEMPENIPTYQPQLGKIILKEVPTPSEIEPDISTDIEQKDIEPPSIEVAPYSHQDLTNLLACKHILILHKKTGICIFELGITMLKIDPQLVSGFLSAISGLFSELKNDLVQKRTILRIFTEEIGDRAFKIVTVEGNHSVTAIILDRTPKYLNTLKQRLRNFSYVFETDFHKKLEDFVGVLDAFRPAIGLLDYHLGLSLITPIQINRAYKQEIPFPTLYKVISGQIDQLAITEGLFVEEIVNQCLFDSEYSYREITEAIIFYLREGILVLTDGNRTLPPFITHKPIIDLGSEEFEETIPEELGIEPAAADPTTEDLDFLSHEETEELIDIDTNWFNELLIDIQTSPLPDSLKSDILERNLLFESASRIKVKSIRTITYSESELSRWARLMTSKGFTLHHKTTNPLNGVKVTLKTDLTTLVCSIAQLQTGDYLLIMGEGN
ncbi:MAG: ATP-binding protein [Candidatus Heimdallarchaeota archaeon]|nr:MAG: ATP-binding protein [Candidatus Heimdallarchaeota archaeon]